MYDDTVIEIEGRMLIQCIEYPCMNWEHPDSNVRYPGQCEGTVGIMYTYCAECIESGNTD